MRLPAVIFALVLTACAVAQVFFPARRIVAPTPVDLPPITDGLRYWWVAGDLSVGQPVNTWTDRISGAIWVADPAPTNTIHGVYFDGAQRLTNSSGFTPPGSSGLDATVFVIHRRLGYESQDLFDYGSGGTFVVLWPVANQNWEFFQSPTSKINFGDQGSESFSDLAYTLETNSLTGLRDLRGYTNGVFVDSATMTQPQETTIRRLGGGADGYLEGLIHELLIYTNALSDDNLEDLHIYATNKYSYASCGSNTSPYLPCTAVFDGSNDYMSLSSSGPTGLADGKTFTFSCWLRIDGNDSLWHTLLNLGVNNSSTRLLIRRNDAKTVLVYAANSSGTAILNISSTATIAQADGWVHLYVCIDLTDTAKRKIYINGTSSGLTVTTYTDDTIDFIGASHLYRVGTTIFATADDKLNGALADVWFNDSYLDDPAQFASGGAPIFLGGNGDLPTGSSPVFFLNGNGQGFGINDGTGGNFTITGILGSTIPP